MYYYISIIRTARSHHTRETDISDAEFGCNHRMRRRKNMKVERKGEEALRMIERNINVKEELHQNKHIFFSFLSYNIFLTAIKQFRFQENFTFYFLSFQKAFKK